MAEGRMRKRASRYLIAVLDTVELYVPMTLFAVLFFAFCLQIFSRYILNNPVPWTMEASSACFMWITLLSASGVRRNSGHIVFDTVFAMYPPRIQVLVTLVVNLAIAVLFAFAVVSIADFLEFLARQRSPILRIPINLLYFPVLYFFVMVALYSAIDAWRAARELFAGTPA